MDGVIKGLASVGCNVIDIGVVTTPVLYFAFAHKRKDGVKAHNDSGWVLIRPSNTEPLLRILSEGKTEDKMNQLLNQTRKTVEREVERIS